MKRFLMIFLLLFSLAPSMYASSLTYDQDANLQDWDRYNGGSIQRVVISPTLNDSRPEQVIFFGNGTFSYDYKWDFPELNQPIFFVFNNIQPGKQVVFGWVSDGLGVTQPFTLEEAGYYYYKFEPETDHEDTSLYIDFVTSTNTTSDPVIVDWSEQKPVGMFSAVQTVVDAFESFAEIVIAFWTIVYYLFIVLVVLGVLGLFIGLALKVLEWAEIFAEKRRKHIYNKRIK